MFRATTAYQSSRKDIAREHSSEKHAPAAHE